MQWLTPLGIFVRTLALQASELLKSLADGWSDWVLPRKELVYLPMEEKGRALNSYTCMLVPFQMPCAPCRRRNWVDLGRAPRVLFFCPAHVVFFLSVPIWIYRHYIFCYVALLPVNYNNFFVFTLGPLDYCWGDLFAIFLVYQATTSLYSRPHAATH